MRVSAPQLIVLVMSCLDIGLVLGGYNRLRESTPEHQDHIEIFSDIFTTALVFWAAWRKP